VLGLDRRGKIWWAVGQIDGRRISKTLRTRDRTVAEFLKRDLEMQLLSGGRVRQMLWPDFEQDFLAWIAPNIKASSLHRYTFIVKRFGAFLSSQPSASVCDVTPHVLAEYLEARKRDVHPTRKHKIGAGGLKSDLKVLRRVFSYAVDSGYLASNPVHRPKSNTLSRETQPFSREEVRRMLDDRLARARPEMRAVLLTFLLTGLRISDVIGLRRNCVDLAAGIIRIMHTLKRGKAVTIAIHPELDAALRAHFADRNAKQAASEFVFSTASGLPVENLDTKLRRLWARVGIEHAAAHRFRDTFSVNLLAQGASLYDVSKLLGITVAVAEKHYSPYVLELQQRATRLISMLSLPGEKL